MWLISFGCTRAPQSAAPHVAEDAACARASDGIYCAHWGTRGFSAVSRWSSDFSDAEGWTDDDAAVRWSTLRTPDLDGDGRSDVCLLGRTAVFCALRRTLERFEPLRRTRLLDSVDDGPDGWGISASLAFPDLDGDGHPDVCIRLGDGLRCALGKADGTFGEATRWAGWPFTDADGAGEPAAVRSLRFADVDGDGRDDVCRRGFDDVVCARSTGSSFADATGWLGPLPDSGARAASFELGDVDGDGRADLCMREGDRAGCYRSTGTDFAPLTSQPLPNGAGGLRVGDVDGDGRADLCVWHPGGVACARSGGAGLFTDWESDVFAAARFDRSAAPTLTLADVDGDGRTDVCGRTHNGLVCAKSDGAAFHAVFDPAADFADGTAWRDRPDVVALSIGRRTQPTATLSNRTTRENEKPGVSDWWVPYPQWSRAHEIEAYSDAVSYAAGATVAVMLSTAAAGDDVDWTLYRTGWYGGAGARAIVAGHVVAYPQPLPTAVVNGRAIEANWHPSFSIPLPADAVSGVYALRLDSAASGKSFFVTFVVREDARRADLVVNRADFTDAAYNDWDGGADKASAYKGAMWVSLNRPLKSVAALEIYSYSSGYFVYEYPMVRWLESQGYDVKYVSDVDVDARANLLDGARAFLSVGHDEYWSAAMRDHVEAARDAGVSLGFFGSDAVDGRIRFADKKHRLFSRTVSDKDAHKLEYGELPLDLTKPPHDNPSDTLTGAHYAGWCSAVHADCLADPAGKLRRADDFHIVEPAHPAFRDVKTQRLPATVGYEYELPYGDPTQLPFALHVLARASGLDLGNHAAPSMVAYRAASGARVFTVGSMHWAHALDGWSGRAAFRSVGGEAPCAPGATDCFTRPASAAAQVTANVLADFGALAATPSADLAQTAAHPWP